MYRFLEISIHKDKLKMFTFLQDNPTLTLKNDDYVKLVYFEPLKVYLSSFFYDDLIVTVTDEQSQSDGWEVVRDLSIELAKSDLVDLLLDLESHKLQEQKQGIGLMLNGWIFQAITRGVRTERDTVQLVRMMFLSGYDYQQVIELFSSITRRAELSRCFIEYAGRLFKEVKIG